MYFSRLVGLVSGWVIGNIGFHMAATEPNWNRAFGNILNVGMFAICLGLFEVLKPTPEHQPKN